MLGFFLTWAKAMLWIKSLHIVFVTSWFAGLFYLPRVLVNLATVSPQSVAERERRLLMTRKSIRFTTLIAVPAVVLSAWLWAGLGIGWAPGNDWMHAKLFVVLLALGYHYSCGVLLRRFTADHNVRGHVWYRRYNVAPVLILPVVVVLVVMKPF